jgi:hypothetical protein
VEASTTRPSLSIATTSERGPAGTLASVVAINAALIERVLEHGARLKRQYDAGLITRQAYGGEMYRLTKAVRHANDLLVVDLADHLPTPGPAALTPRATQALASCPPGCAGEVAG